MRLLQMVCWNIGRAFLNSPKSPMSDKTKELIEFLLFVCLILT
jgi:hypothetical protein